jgi:uncharacterized repeat protein (TIGR01451 family)
MLLYIPSAFALTPAGTEIRNQVSGTYKDADSTVYYTNSNQVITIVLPLYGLSIYPDGTVSSPGQQQNAVPGAIVYFPYTLTNTGNEVDDFTLAVADSNCDFDPTGSAEIYYDVNGNGVADPGEPVSTTISDINYNESVSLIVSYPVPQTATEGQSACVDLIGTSVSDNSKIDSANVHKTNVVNDAVIVATKSVSASQAATGDTLTYTISASNTGNKSTTSDTLEVETGGVTDSLYGVIIVDPLPTDNNELSGDPLIITDSTTVQGTPVSGSVVYWVGTTTPSDSDSLKETAWTDGTWYTAFADAESQADPIRAVGFITGDTNEGSGIIDPGQSFDFEYSVRIPIDYQLEDVKNRAFVEYDDADNIDQHVITNQTITTVGSAGYRTAAIMIGPEDAPTDHDQLNTGLSSADTDTTKFATIAAGAVRDTILTVYNASNSSDIINLFISTSADEYPDGWNFGFYHLDGITPLNDSNSDGHLDVGTVAAGDSVSFVLKTLVPTDATAGSDSILVIYAQSTNQISTSLPTINTTISGFDATPTYTDTVTVGDASGFSIGDYVNINGEVKPISDIVDNNLIVPNMTADPSGGIVTGIISGYNATVVLFEDITSVKIDYHNNDATDSKAKSFDAHPADSTYVDMPLELCNNAEQADTYTLSDSLPDEWRIEYYKDLDCDKVLENNERTQTRSIYVASKDCECLFARVYFPTGLDSIVSGYPVKLVATSTNDTAIADTINNRVVIPLNYGIILVPDRFGSGIPGYTVEYIHNLKNTGNAPIPATTSYLTIDSDQGWTYVLFQYNPADSTFTQLNFSDDKFELAYSVGVNATQDSTTFIKVKLFIPTSAPEGFIETANIIVYHGSVPDGADSGTDPDLYDMVTDITQVSSSNLLLQKRVVNMADAPDTNFADAGTFSNGSPGDTLIYYVYFKNISSSDIDTLMIYDPIPVNTTYIPNSATFLDENEVEISRTLEYSLDYGETWTGSDDASTTNIRYHYDDNAGNYIILQSGEEGWVKFKATID